MVSYQKAICFLLQSAHLKKGTNRPVEGRGIQGLQVEGLRTFSNATGSNKGN